MGCPGGASGDPVVDGDDGAIGDGDQFRPIAVEVLVAAPVTIVQPVALHQSPVDGEGLGRVDVAAVDGDAQIPVQIRRAAGRCRQPAIALNRRPEYPGGRRSTVTCGPSIRPAAPPYMPRSSNPLRRCRSIRWVT